MLLARQIYLYQHRHYHAVHLRLTIDFLRQSILSTLSIIVTQMHGVVMPVLIQVNLAREEQKGGIYIEDYPALLDAASRLPG